jgi:hypothetical protein
MPVQSKWAIRAAIRLASMAANSLKVGNIIFWSISGRYAEILVDGHCDGGHPVRPMRGQSLILENETPGSEGLSVGSDLGRQRLSGGGFHETGDASFLG